MMGIELMRDSVDGLPEPWRSEMRAFLLSRDHPPAGLSHSRADDEGPGASARASGCRSRPVSEALTTEAPAPDEAMILKHARAC